MKPCRHRSGRIHLFPQIFFWLVILLALSTLTVTATTVFAQSWYIKPSAEIPVRRGQGTDYKILVVLENGTKVSILEENDAWVKIQTQNGTEGWMLRRYLSKQPPLDIVVEELQTKNADLQKLEARISQELSSSVTTNSQLKSELSSCATTLNKTKEDFRFLEEETADVIAIKNNLTKSEKQVTELSTELKKVSQENEYLKRSKQTKWYLAGACTLIFGWLAGHLSAKSRKKRSSLY